MLTHPEQGQLCLHLWWRYKAPPTRHQSTRCHIPGDLYLHNTALTTSNDEQHQVFLKKKSREIRGLIYAAAASCVSTDYVFRLPKTSYQATRRSYVTRSLRIFVFYLQQLGSRYLSRHSDSTDWIVRGSISGGRKITCLRQNPSKPALGPTNTPPTGTNILPGCIAARVWHWPPTPFSAEVQA